MTPARRTRSRPRRRGATGAAHVASLGAAPRPAARAAHRHCPCAPRVGLRRTRSGIDAPAGCAGRRRWDHRGRPPLGPRRARHRHGVRGALPRRRRGGLHGGRRPRGAGSPRGRLDGRQRRLRRGRLRRRGWLSPGGRRASVRERRPEAPAVRPGRRRRGSGRGDRLGSERRRRDREGLCVDALRRPATSRDRRGPLRGLPSSRPGHRRPAGRRGGVRGRLPARAGGRRLSTHPDRACVHGDPGGRGLDGRGRRPRRRRAQRAAGPTW